LKDPYILPPKRLLATTLIPSAWVNDGLIDERKKGLASYLNAVLSTPRYQDSAILSKFLTPEIGSEAKFSPEDALPSTFSHKEAVNLLTSAARVEPQAAMIAGAYYPDWCADTNPLEKIDFSKFDILFFGRSSPSHG
jgi:chitinase